MKAKEIIVLKTFITESYPYVKMDNPEGDDVWYIMLKEYKFKKMQKVLMDYIKSGKKFAPGIADLIKLYEDNTIVELNDIISFMEEQGYFDDINPIDAEWAMWNKENRLKKAMMWIENDNVPSWLQKDINKYYKLIKTEKITSGSVAKIEISNDH